MSITIESLTAGQAVDALPELIALLEDAVAGGASVGFVPPLAPDEAADYWRGVLPAVAAGDKLLLAARADGRIVGSVQLALESRANGNHRGEVQKLLVLRAQRRQGIGEALMRALEAAAVTAGRTLLVLDTRVEDDGPRLYARLGFVTAGVIPGYARNADGGFDATAYMYKRLTTTD